MDGFPFYPNHTTPSFSLVPTLLQVKQQMDFIDQFLTLYIPEYSQFKNYVLLESRNQMQNANGMASTMHTPTFNYNPTTVPPPSSVPLQEPQSTMPTFTATTSSAYPFLQGDQMGLFYNLQNNATNVPIPVKPKPRRKQALVKKTPITGSPSTLKKRGRKRKHPIVNPTDGSVSQVPQTVLQNPQNSEGIIRMYVPPQPLVQGQTLSVDHQKDSESSRNVPVNGEESHSSLDILAAVSYILKQKGLGVQNLPFVQEIPPNSSNDMTGGGDQQQNRPITFSPATMYDNNNISNTQNNDHDRMEAINIDSSSQEYNGAVVEVEEDSRETELQGSHHPENDGCRPEEMQLNTQTQSILSSSISSNSITQSQEEYNAVVGGAPEQELTV